MSEGPHSKLLNPYTLPVTAEQVRGCACLPPGQDTVFILCGWGELPESMSIFLVRGSACLYPPGQDVVIRFAWLGAAGQSTR